ncbi:MAG: anhydro-N-acetylmuramic acid kinase, partial [Bdellovibrionales bacterium]|nr:anhydro-N-acetylmuramic acid kinase [Bdellovibrionales bacterium]NQZ19536.1 anhydro-N-acetylmuramic acid kinase [Bdellovibrionales bacterium]
MATRKKYKALGIMIGTSIDGVDYALIESDGTFKNMSFKKHKHFSIPPELKKKLLQAATNQLNTYEVSSLHYDLGRLYGKHIKTLKKSWNWDVVGLHGQTV